MKKAADCLWDASVPPHHVHDQLLVRCLDATDGNYAKSAELFAPCRHYVSSPSRGSKWNEHRARGRQ